MHGYTIDECLKLNFIKDLDAPDAAKDAPARAKQIMDGEWIKAEINHIRKDGTIFPVEISAGLLEFMGHKYFLAIDRDITDLVSARLMLCHDDKEHEPDVFNIKKLNSNRLRQK